MRIQLERLEDRTTPADVRLLPSQNVISPGLGPVSAWAAGDLNGDQRPDMVLASNSSKRISVLLNTTPLNDATVTYAPKQEFKSGRRPTWISLADVNQDGLLDVAVSNGNSDTLAIFLNQTPVNATTVQFQHKWVYHIDHNCTSFADLNGDGTLDLVAINRETKPSTITVFRNDTAVGATAPTFKVVAKLWTDALGSRRIALKDVNDDQRPDVVATTQDAGTVSVFLNETPTSATEFTFGARRTFTTNPLNNDLIVADVNGDAKPDILTSGQAKHPSVGLLVNETDHGAALPSFTLLQLAGDNQYSRGRPVIGDLNNDGVPDVVLNNRYTTRVPVLLGTGIAGTPLTETPVFLGTRITSALFGLVDLNGDGRQDFISFNTARGPERIQVSINAPDASPES